MTVTSSTVKSRRIPISLTRIVIDDATGNAVEAIAAAAGSTHYVWGILGTLPADNTLTLKSGTDAITPPLATTGLLVPPPAPGPAGGFPIAQTGVGEALNVDLASAGQLSLTLWVQTATD